MTLMQTVRSWVKVPSQAVRLERFCRVRTVTYRDGRVVKAHECEGTDVDALDMTDARVITETGHWIRERA
jgi:hypothetical protein